MRRLKVECDYSFDKTLKTENTGRDRAMGGGGVEGATAMVI